MTSFTLTKPVLLVAFRRPDLTRQMLDVAARRASPPALSRRRCGARGPAGRSRSGRGSQTGARGCRLAVRGAGGITPRRTWVPAAGCPPRFPGCLKPKPTGSSSKMTACRSPGFFRFCEEVLDRYRNEPAVMGVSGQLGASGAVPPRGFAVFFQVHPDVGLGDVAPGLGALRPSTDRLAAIPRRRGLSPPVASTGRRPRIGARCWKSSPAAR